MGKLTPNIICFHLALISLTQVCAIGVQVIRLETLFKWFSICLPLAAKAWLLQETQRKVVNLIIKLFEILALVSVKICFVQFV